MNLERLALMTHKKWVTIVYLLQALGFLFGITWVAGVVINYMISDSAESDPVASSHSRYQIRTFWYGLAMLLVSSVLVMTVVLSPIGFLGYIALAFWVIYRIVKGAIRLSANQAI